MKSRQFLRHNIWRERLDAFSRDQRANIAVAVAIMSPVVIGAAGLAIDVGMWEKAHKHMQQAADGSASSAAVAYAVGSTTTPQSEGKSVAATYGYTDGSSGVTVTVNQPPTSGSHMTTTGAVEVIISQPQRAYFSGILGMGSVPVSARAVAIGNGLACILALDQTASVGVGVQGSPSVNAVNCNIYSDSGSATSVDVGGSAAVAANGVGASGGIYGSSNITASQGLSPYGSIISDPYSNVPMPTFTSCDYNNLSISKKTLTTLNPGVYCGGLNLNAGADVALNPGTYIFDGGSLSVNGSATLTGAGVTLFFTCSACATSKNANYATATINGGANVTLSAPTSGPLAGILWFGDRNMPVGTSFKLDGGATQSFNGATYIPQGAVEYAGGASSSNLCTPIVADTISFSGTSYITLNCKGMGTKLVGGSAKVVE